MRVPDERRHRVEVHATATAEIAADAGGLGMPGQASRGYPGPLAYRQGQPMRPDVAIAFRPHGRGRARRGRAGAPGDQRLPLRRWAGKALRRRPDPKCVAPPGTSLHRYASELDLGPPAAYGWLDANRHLFGFIRRYAWEPWHYGFTSALFIASDRPQDGADPTGPRLWEVAQTG